MADSPLVAVCKALVDALNAHTFDQPIEAVRTWKDGTEDLEGLTGIRCEVSPVGRTVNWHDAGSSRFDCEVQIAVRKALTAIAEQDEFTGDVNLEDIDLVDSVQAQILEHLLTIRSLTTSRGTAVFIIPPEEDQNYSPEHLRTDRLFTGIETYRFSLVI